MSLHTMKMGAIFAVLKFVSNRWRWHNSKLCKNF